MTLRTKDELKLQAVSLSPRLAQLGRQIQRGNAAALEYFWQEISREGTPLVEPLERDDTQSRVTFIWRATSEVKEVLLLSSLSSGDSVDKQLSHLLSTDLWYKTYIVRNDLLATYRFQVDGVSFPDPLNSQISQVPGDKVSPYDAPTQFSIVRLPGVSSSPWLTPLPGASSGQVSLHPFYSSLLDNMYRVWVYTPPNYTRRAEPYPLLLLLDGWVYRRVLHAPTILDNLLDVGALPPLVAVMLGHPDRETRSREFAFCSPFLDFITQELLPWIRHHYSVTSDPARTVVGGLSLSGVTAANLALRHPDLFGNVLSQSGSFQWKLPEDTEHERLARQVVSAPTVPVRFHLDAGLLETRSGSDGGPSLLISNRHLRQLLQAKGYVVHYEEFNGGHDYICWQDTLVDGLLALFKGFGTEPDSGMVSRE